MPGASVGVGQAVNLVQAIPVMITGGIALSVSGDSRNILLYGTPALVSPYLIDSL